MGIGLPVPGWLETFVQPDSNELELCTVNNWLGAESKENEIEPPWIVGDERVTARVE